MLIPGSQSNHEQVKFLLRHCEWKNPVQPEQHQFMELTEVVKLLNWSQTYLTILCHGSPSIENREFYLFDI